MRISVLVVVTMYCALICLFTACEKTNSPYKRAGAGQSAANQEDSTVSSDEDSGVGITEGNAGPSSKSTPSANAGMSANAGSGGNGGAGAAGKSATGRRTAGAGGGGRGGSSGKAPANNQSNSCCIEHTSSGCSDKAVQDCICEKLPDCCKKEWSRSCVLLTEGHYCQPDVRNCVCGSQAEGGWEQATCCSQEWTTFCETVATEKCKATTICPL